MPFFSLFEIFLLIQLWPPSISLPCPLQRRTIYESSTSHLRAIFEPCPFLSSRYCLATVFAIPTISLPYPNDIATPTLGRCYAYATPSLVPSISLATKTPKGAPFSLINPKSFPLFTEIWRIFYIFAANSAKLTSSMFLSLDKTHASMAVYSLIRNIGSSFQNLFRRCIRKSS